MEQKYSKVEGESLGILKGIRTNKWYLYGTKFEVIVDHQPLVSLYSRKKELPVRVAKHISKLKDFCFEVRYEPETRNPSDYGSWHLPPLRKYTRVEREDMGVKDTDEDMEVLVNRVEDMLPELSQ